MWLSCSRCITASTLRNTGEAQGREQPLEAKLPPSQSSRLPGAHGAVRGVWGRPAHGDPPAPRCWLQRRLTAGACEMILKTFMIPSWIRNYQTSKSFKEMALPRNMLPHLILILSNLKTVNDQFPIKNGILLRKSKLLSQLCSLISGSRF